jgi:hypothetical protein
MASVWDLYVIGLGSVGANIYKFLKTTYPQPLGGVPGVTRWDATNIINLQVVSLPLICRL